MAPTELGPRRSVVDRLPHQLAGVGVGAQQAHHVARHLPDALVHDPVAQARHQAWPLGVRVGAAELDAQRAVGAHFDGVGAHALLAEHALAGRHVELPVVPRAGQQVTGELALTQPVALVRAGLVEGVDAGARAHEQQAPLAVAVGHLDQLHRRRLEVGQGHVQLHAHDATTSTELDVKARERADRRAPLLGLAGALRLPHRQGACATRRRGRGGRRRRPGRSARGRSRRRP